MENRLYPLKFKPILKDKIWGGHLLSEVLNKAEASKKCGESWEISGVPDDISVVSNGWLAGNSLEEIIEIYMGDLVGERVFNKFGITFPLLIKFIDASADLSIQVHPDDSLAIERHKSYGKTEMWYIVDTKPGARLVIGFNKQLEKDEYLQNLKNGTLEDIMNYEEISGGDVYFIPAGRVHAIGAGTLLAEIQQTSDVTYRIYDYKRKDDQGNERELHTELALDAIDYTFHDHYKTIYTPEINKSTEVVKCPYFETRLIHMKNKSISRDYTLLDSFVVYMCVEGEVKMKYPEGEEKIKMGETVLIPATFEEIDLIPLTGSKILEVFINQ